MARQFVRVRLTRIDTIDLRRFRFDLDLTWACFFMNSDQAIYGRYGGRDATGADSRQSLKGLAFALGKALEAHKAGTARPEPLEGPAFTIRNFKSAGMARGCVHCHNAKEMRIADAKADGTWRREDIHEYPPPDNLGIVLDVDSGNGVAKVVKGSAAEAAGLRPGHRVTRLAGHPVASFADASFALDNWRSDKPVPVTFVDGKDAREAMLAVAPGWRKTNITWRPSLLDMLPAVPFRPDELTARERTDLGIPADQAAFRQGPRVHSTLAEAGIKAGDIVLAIGDGPIRGSSDDLLGHVRRNYLKGDTVLVKVSRAGQSITIPIRLK